MVRLNGNWKPFLCALIVLAGCATGLGTAARQPDPWLESAVYYQAWAERADLAITAADRLLVESCDPVMRGLHDNEIVQLRAALREFRQLAADVVARTRPSVLEEWNTRGRALYHEIHRLKQVIRQKIGPRQPASGADGSVDDEPLEDIYPQAEV